MQSKVECLWFAYSISAVLERLSLFLIYLRLSELFQKSSLDLAVRCFHTAGFLPCLSSRFNAVQVDWLVLVDVCF